jgi:FkbM family methyltransferase
MAARYGIWLGARLTGRSCTAGLPGGGSITGFRRFTDYWSLNMPSAAEYQLLRRFVRPGMIVADVGANLGAFAVTMGRLGPARVFAFEPSPDTARTLRANVERNRLDTIEVVQAAVSDGPGRAELTDDPLCSARNHLVADRPTAATPTVGVETVTLDEFCADRRIPRLAFVKSDTEGAETRVIRGAAGLLRDRRIDALLVEVCGPYLAELGSSVREFVAAVEGCGYAAYRLTPAGTAGTRLAAADLERVAYENVLLLPG